MKIEIEIPDFVPPERIIHILDGTKQKIGYIEPHTRDVYVKVSECCMCGKCCEKIGCKDLKFLNGGMMCTHKPDRPILCIVSESNLSECTSKYIKV
jgi:hypothetical protein